MSSAFAVVSGVLRTIVFVPGIDGVVNDPEALVVPLSARLTQLLQRPPVLTTRVASLPRVLLSTACQLSLMSQLALTSEAIVVEPLFVFPCGTSPAAKKRAVSVVAVGAPAGASKNGLICPPLPEPEPYVVTLPVPGG